MTGERGESRRAFLKKSVTVAWATPLILTMTADKAGAQAFSCAGPSPLVFCGSYDEDLGQCRGTPAFPCCNACTPLAAQQDAPCFCE